MANFNLRYDSTNQRWEKDTSVAQDGSGPWIRLPVVFNEIVFVIDAGTSVITTGVKGFIRIDFDCVIQKVTTLSSDDAVTTGSIVIDIWKDTYANYPPTVIDTITASAKPTISSGVKAEDSTLTGWTTTINAGDVLGIKVDSITSLKRVVLILKVKQ